MVANGNGSVCSCGRLIKASKRAKVRCGMEQPLTSMMWLIDDLVQDRGAMVLPKSHELRALTKQFTTAVSFGVCHLAS